MKKKGLIFVLSSPSGGGKTTIARSVIQKVPDLKRSISCTTRARRKGERKNIDYFFATKEEFQEKIKQNAFAEWAKVLDNYYGTPKKNIEAALDCGKSIILSIDVQGALQVKKVYPEAVLIFILPPSMNVLKKRLTGRKTDAKAEIQKRLKLAGKELAYAKKYGYIVVNNSLKKAIGEVQSIIIAEGCKVR